jgi:hypothetical protein
VVVDDFDFFGIFIHPEKADSESIVDADAPLARTVSSKRFQPIARRNSHVLEALGKIELDELPQRWPLDAHEPSDSLQPEQGFGIGALERLDGHSNAVRY